MYTAMIDSAINATTCVAVYQRNTGARYVRVEVRQGDQWVEVARYACPVSARQATAIMAQVADVATPTWHRVRNAMRMTYEHQLEESCTPPHIQEREDDGHV